MVGRIIETDEDVAEGTARPCGNRAALCRGAGADRAAAAAPPGRRVRDPARRRSSASRSRRLRRLRSGTASSRSVQPSPPPTSPPPTRRCAPRGCPARRSLMAAALAGSGLDFAALRGLPDDEVVATLIRLKGIGVWTAEIYAMFSLGPRRRRPRRPRAPRRRATSSSRSSSRPSELASSAEMSLAGGPWRSVAARRLWAYYRTFNRREGVR